MGGNWRGLLSGAVVAALVVVTGTAATGNAAAPGKGGKAETVYFSPDRWNPGLVDTMGHAFGHAGIGQIFCRGPAEEGSLSMLLDLPDGARVTKLTVYHGDQDTDYDLEFGVGWAGIGMGGDALNDIVPPSSSDENSPFDHGYSVPVQRVDLVPTSPLVLDRSQHDYFVWVHYPACDTWVGEHGVDAFPSLVVDSVVVEYRR